MSLWAAKWRSENQLDGRTERLILWHRGTPLAPFRTRAECRAWIKAHYGYIAEREDLRREPHGWRLPIAVRVSVIEVGNNAKGAEIQRGG